MRKFIVIPLFIFLFLFIFSSRVHASQIFDYTYDLKNAYTQSGFYNDTALIGNSLQITGNQDGEYWSPTRVYMVWNISMLSGANISDAKLYLYQFSATLTPNIISIYNASESWTRGLIKWTNQPDLEVFYSNNSITNTTGYKSFDIKSLLQNSINAGTNMSIAMVQLINTSANTNNFWSKEYPENRPYISVDYTIGGCSAHAINGTWCDSYNLTPMCTDYVTSNCWNPYTTSSPNPFNASKNAFTTFTNINGADCGIIQNQCPTGYMCVQGSWRDPIPTNPEYPLLYPIYRTSLGNNWTWRGSIQCYNGATGDALYYNESSYPVNITDIYPNIMTCENPSLWNNNSFACTVNNCHYCWSTTSCINPSDNCPNVCQNASAFSDPASCTAGFCYWYNNQCNSYQNPVPQPTPASANNPASQIALFIGSGFGITDLATAETMSSLLFSILLGVGIIFLMFFAKIKGVILGQIFLISEVLFLVMFTFIGWFPAWSMVVLMVLSSLLIAKTLKVF